MNYNYYNILFIMHILLFFLISVKICLKLRNKNDDFHVSGLKPVYLYNKKLDSNHIVENIEESKLGH